ncbi:MAG: hypothetical protein JWN95_1145 [Frankiales bacterium]|nr:hypothetical protein [Frankiales bacterium]
MNSTVRPGQPSPGPTTLMGGMAMPEQPKGTNVAGGEPPDLPAEQSATDQADLSAAFNGLSQLALGAQSLEEALTRIATLAVRAIPGADGGGLTMLEEGRPDVMIVSAAFVRAVDDAQYGIGEGPCIMAATTGQTIRSGSLGNDGNWPRFGPRARDLGVNSALSLPLVMDEEVLGALNIYAHDTEVFDDHAQELGELFSVPAAIAVHNARVLAQAQLLSAQLSAALTSRTVIDQAIGIIRSRSGGSSDDAFASLRTLSQNQNVKLVVVATAVVDEAVRRARARRP